VDDNATSRKQLQVMLQSDPALIVDVVAHGAEALKALTERAYSAIITDLRMPQMSGMQLLEEIQKRKLSVAVIVTTGFGSINEAVQAMRLGATDFLTKPVDLEHLRLVLGRALRERALLDEVQMLRERLQSDYSFQNMLSKSPRMHAVFELIGHVADTASTVLIEGETGTGKELVAQAIHDASGRRQGPLVAVNCAAMPETLLESELFGHEKGSFTGAQTQRKGRFEMADAGTLFLDEVGEIPATMQAKLLRVLQERRFERVGGTESIEVDVRIVAATNRPLTQAIKDGKFREDLYYRLNVVKIDLPPLRERLEDLPLLATHFVAKYARPGSSPAQIAPEAMEILLHYHWPGNIRELENVIERASVTSCEKYIRPKNLPPEILEPSRVKEPFQVDLTRPLTDQLPKVIAAFEERYLRKALRKTGGHVGRTARITGLSRRSITDKIALYKIDKSKFKES
jgi:DNA-binding NtrC family response regulator